MSSSSTKNNLQNKDMLYTEAVSGLTAGIVTCIFLHPIDLMKTRLQVENTRLNLNNVLGRGYNLFKSIIKKNGFINGLYSGLSPNLLGSSFSWAIYFAFYDKIKSKFPAKQKIQTNTGEKIELSNTGYFASSCAAGALVLTLTNPIWVLKTRMCLVDYSEKNNNLKNKHQTYTNVFDGLYKLYKQEGITKGYYRGYLTGLMATTHGGIQFIFYERFKLYYTKRNKTFSNLDYLWMSSLSKTLASIATHPLQLIKTRMQNHENQRNGKIYYVVLDLLKNEGLSGMYKGLGLNIVRVLPGTCITFVVYENVKKYMMNNH